MFHYHHNFYFKPEDICFSDYLSVAANVVTIVGIVGFYWAWKQYRDFEINKQEAILNEKLRFINALKYQLKVIGAWTGYEGNGYSGDGISWMQSSQVERADPFLFVTEIASAPLQEISILPAASDMGTKTNQINEAIANLNQWLRNFDTFLTEIRAFKFSRDPYKNILLSKKLHEGKKLTDLDEGEEREFAEKLLSFQHGLHFNVISDDDGKKLHYWHKKLTGLIEDSEKELENKKGRY